ncbi:hypothetical protein [uncultured Rubinisphaera sp.]|uniref:hypothetical protein n=1 Tax=uncultured Rubinisphaera sp. TaxID=1678686 RepID=UPI0030DB0CA8
MHLQLTRMLILLTPLLATGCFSPGAPVWMEDSQSFIYTFTDGAVAQYDMQKQATRILCNPNLARPERAAISPDQQFVAIPFASWTETSDAAGVNIVRLSDGVLVSSELKEWGMKKEPTTLDQPASAYWSPDGQRILIYYKGGIDELLGKCVMYDVQQKTLSPIKGALPAVSFTAPIGCSPFSPDGSGYLAMRMTLDGPVFSFVDWMGWESQLSTTEEVNKKINFLGDDHETKGAKKAATFPLPNADWVGNVLQCSTRLGTLHFDIKKKEVTFHPLTEKLQGQLNQIDGAEDADKGWITYQVAPFQESPIEIHCLLNETVATLRFDLVDTKEKRRRVLFEGELRAKTINRPLTCSPDGKHILVWFNQNGKDLITVVRNDGEIISELKTNSSQ